MKSNSNASSSLTFPKILLTVSIVLLVFFVLRLYRLDQTLDFFGDTGRDFVVLQNWLETGKPPLLGPSTSVISFNQSAVYFYVLMPFYLLSGNSVFATVYAVLAVYTISFVMGSWFLYRYRKDLVIPFLLIAIIITTHPEFITQHREVWNPSFVIPFFFASILLYLVKDVFSNNWTQIIFTLGLSMAVSLSYSVAPAALVLFCMYLLKEKNKLQLLFWQVTTALMVNLPTLAFEARHNFTLTRGLPTQEVLQTSTDLGLKITRLTEYLFTSPMIAFVMLGSLLAYCIYLFKNNPKQKLLQNEFVILFLAFVVALVLTLALPISLHSHYIFGIGGLLLGALLVLPVRVLLLVVGVSLLVWLQPAQLESYFQPITVPVSAKQACAQTICSSYPTPLYVGLNSSSHNHQALEYVYLLKENGCQAYSAFQYTTELTETMVVFSENSPFEFGKTDFYELSLFKPETHLETIRCSEGLQADVLKR